MGIPSVITFSPDGGDKHFQADRVVRGIYILKNGMTQCGCLPKEAIEDTMSVSCEWLTVKQNVRDAQMVISVTPTNSTKTRTLGVELDDGDCYSSITIKQTGKKN